MPEILVILVVALIIFGPRKLPELGKTLGESLNQFKKASEDFKKTWESEVELEKRRIDPPRYTSAPEPAEPERVISSAETPPAESSSTVAPDTAEMAVAQASLEGAATQATETKRDWM